MLTFDLEVYICQSPFSLSPPFDPSDGAGVGAAVREVEFCQIEAEVSSFQSVSLHGCSAAVKLVLVFKFVTFLLTLVDG